MVAQTVGQGCLSRYPARWCGNEKHLSDGQSEMADAKPLSNAIVDEVIE
jgi:hypothetical protein